jgi:hypothetical protein
VDAAVGGDHRSRALGLVTGGSAPCADAEGAEPEISTPADQVWPPLWVTLAKIGEPM